MTMREPLSARGQALASRRRYRIMELARGVPDVITLGRGDPDQPTPAHIVDAACTALRAWATHYTAAEGMPALREAIARKLDRENGLTYSPDEVLVTTGAQEALYLAAQVLLGDGDEVLIADPYYGAYTPIVEAAGGHLVPVAVDAGSMEPVEAVLKAAVTPRTKLLVIVTPNNPSTTVLSPDVLGMLARLAQAHDLWVISDEIYEKLTFDGAVHHSIAAIPSMRERTVVVNGFAKTYCMTGWRVGYAAGPAAVITAMARLKQAVNICAPAVAQAGALAALTGPQDSVADLIGIYQQRRQAVLAALRGMHLPYVRHQGTFYVYADVSGAGMPSDRFAEELLLTGRVLVFPSTEFGSGRGHIRLSLLQPMDVLEDALNRVAAVWARYAGGG